MNKYNVTLIYQNKILQDHFTQLIYLFFFQSDLAVTTTSTTITLPPHNISTSAMEGWSDPREFNYTSMYRLDVPLLPLVFLPRSFHC